MVFLKHFDTSKQTLFGAGKTYMPRTSKVGDLIPIINEKMRWISGTALKLYEVTAVLASSGITLSHCLGN
jgi:ubiquitin carboxyl-terminal hydrolase 7